MYKSAAIYEQARVVFWCSGQTIVVRHKLIYEHAAVDDKGKSQHQQEQKDFSSVKNCEGKWATRPGIDAGRQFSDLKSS